MKTQMHLKRGEPPLFIASATYLLQQRLELFSYSGIAQKAAFWLLIQARKTATWFSANTAADGSTKAMTTGTMSWPHIQAGTMTTTAVRFPLETVLPYMMKTAIHREHWFRTVMAITTQMTCSRTLPSGTENIREQAKFCMNRNHNTMVTVQNPLRIHSFTHKKLWV